MERLPTELLVLIFDSLPFLARIRSISFICKRWRVAVLLSFKHITFSSSSTEEVLDVSLFPMLSSVALTGDVRCTSLPGNQLSSLSLSLQCSDKNGWWVSRFHSGRATLFDCRFPNLTSLFINNTFLSIREAHSPLLYFVERHISGLQELSLQHNTLLNSVIKLHMPKVTKLCLLDVTHPMMLTTAISNSPKLEHLTLQPSSPHEWFFKLNRSIITALVELRFKLAFSPSTEQLAFFKSLPKLTTIRGTFLPGDYASFAADVLLLPHQPWSTLATSPHVTHLSINQEYLYSVNFVPLLHLTNVSFHLEMPVQRSLSLAQQILRFYPNLSLLSIGLVVLDEGLQQFRDAFKEIYLLAVQSNLYQLRLCIPKGFDRLSLFTQDVQQFVTFGWLRLHIVQLP